MYDALDVRDLVSDELTQRRISGWDVRAIEETVEAALANPRTEAGRLLGLMDTLQEVPRSAAWPYDEPDATTWLDLPPDTPRGRLPDVETHLDDRLLGAWLGRCAGCTLGKPVEGWTADEIDQLLRRMSASPTDDFLPAPDPWPDDLPPPKPSWPESTRGRISGAPRDDDMDFTVLGLLRAEEHGTETDAAEVGRQWLMRLPILRLFTAERAAYRNLIMGVMPPATALVHNPYREWIGALIRADIHGYLRPGRPTAAARAAAVDASLSHTGNGVYAAMWAAALVSLAMGGTPLRESLAGAAGYVPRGSRLAEAIENVHELHARKASWRDVVEAIAQRWKGYPWVHAVPSAAVIAAALLWGDGDFGHTIGLAVMAGGDTDSTAATAGSVCGALLGAKLLPEHWVTPFEDRLRTAISGVPEVRLSDLASRTGRLVATTAP